MAEPDEMQRARVDLLRDKLTQIQEALMTLEKAQRAAKRVQLGFTLLILVALLVCGGAIARHMSIFTAENLLPAVGNRTAEFLPYLVRSVARVAESVTPLYLEELNRQAPLHMPRIMHVAEQEGALFFTQLEADTQRHFSMLVDQLAKREQAHLTQQLPALSDAERSDIFVDNLYAVLRESLAMVLLEKFQSHLEPVHAFQQTVDQYQREIAGRRETDVELKLLATGLELIGKRLAEETR